MKKEVILAFLNDYADWEIAFIAPLLNGGTEPGRSKYSIKTFSITSEPVVSIGGLRVLPDYDIDSLPDDYAGIILVGGMSWFTPETKKLIPVIMDAASKGKMIAGICNASVFLGSLGLLNNIRHTSNTLEYLKLFAGPEYCGEDYYENRQSVRDGNIITANGTAYLEFCRDILYALEADTEEKIEESYRFYKEGFYKE